MINQVLSIAAIERDAEKAKSSHECPYPRGSIARSYWMAHYIAGAKPKALPTIPSSQNDETIY